MDDYFEIPVTYKGEERDFKTRLLMTGYTYKIEIEGQLILYAPDEDQNYRALVDESQLSKNSKLEVGLLQAIAQVIESIRT